MSDPWLQDYIIEQTRLDPRRHGSLPDGRSGLMLMGTLGYASYLLPDSSVWVEEDKDWTGPEPRIEWRQATYQEAVGNLKVAARLSPVLERLLPTRPDAEPACSSCGGRGEFAVSGPDVIKSGTVICGECYGLGWRAAPT